MHRSQNDKDREEKTDKREIDDGKNGASADTRLLSPDSLSLINF